MSDLPVVAISIGDTNGIGTEIILKSFESKELFKICTPVLYCDYDFVEKLQKIYKTKVNLFKVKNGFKTNVLNIKNVWEKNPELKVGHITKEAGMAAFISLENAAKDVYNARADVLVTAPINKNSINSNFFPFKGHTHYLAKIWGGEALMVLMNKKMRIALLTDHVPLKNVSLLISKELIEKKVKILYRSLKLDFKIKTPKLAILGMNPHASDNGIIGEEEQKIIIPTINKLNQIGLNIKGPFSADGFFGQKNYLNFDGVLSCYHDQGLVGFKALSFGNGINYTAGLSSVRTSPDHGTAFDIAGKNIANQSSFLKAVKSACQIWNNKK